MIRVDREPFDRATRDGAGRLELLLPRVVTLFRERLQVVRVEEESSVSAVRFDVIDDGRLARTHSTFRATGALTERMAIELSSSQFRPLRCAVKRVRQLLSPPHIFAAGRRPLDGANRIPDGGRWGDRRRTIYL